MIVMTIDTELVNVVPNVSDTTELLQIVVTKPGETADEATYETQRHLIVAWAYSPSLDYTVPICPGTNTQGLIFRDIDRGVSDVFLIGKNVHLIPLGGQTGEWVDVIDDHVVMFSDWLKEEREKIS